MRKLIACAAVFTALLIGTLRAEARIVVSVDKSTQRMSVSVDGVTRYVWEVSTGRENFGTPSGVFKPERLAPVWFSRKYYNSPMPHSIFFHNGFAIHGSYEISKLGGPASHGCIRLHPRNAATLYSLVERQGPGVTTIVVSGDNPTYAKHSQRSQARYKRRNTTGSVAENYEHRHIAHQFVDEDPDSRRWGRSH